MQDVAQMRVGHIVATPQGGRPPAPHGGRRGRRGACAASSPPPQVARQLGMEVPATESRRPSPTSRRRWCADTLADRYREVREAFRWHVPADFNIAHWCCRRWAGDGAIGSRCSGRTSRASARAYTYAQLPRRVEPPLERARRPRRRPRRPRGAHPAAAPRDRRSPTSRASRWARSRCRCRSSSVPRRSSTGSPTAARASRSSIRPPPRTSRRCASALPGLEHVIGVAGARGRGMLDWDALLARRLDATSTAVPTRRRRTLPRSSTPAAPPARRRAHCCRTARSSATCRASSTRTTASRSEGDLFWSPADWAWTGGLWDALMPTLYHGRAILGYRGRFDPERAFDLMERYAVRNAFLFPTALKMMMNAVPRAARALRRAPALADERRRAGGPGGIPLGARGSSASR